MPVDARGRGAAAVRAGAVALEPVPRTAPAHNLPTELSSFVGREAELAEILAALAGTRLLSLTGPGGCGKTRLARRAAAAALDSHPDGTWWLELAPLADPALVGPVLARALGVRPLPGQGDLEAAIAFLARRRALVLLDNGEHLLQACAEATVAILRTCPRVTVMVTSREPLRVEGETEWRVPALADDDAVRLFAERAARVGRGLRADGSVVVRVCRALDGLPLAIELAAARTRMLTVEQIADGLDDALRLLTGGVRTALPRHQTLRGSVDWSHALLDEGERAVFRRLAVFLGGFTLGTAEEVCAGEGVLPEDVLDRLGSLVEKSLVDVEERAGATRYRLLEPVRQYALDALRKAGEEAAARDRHRDAFLRLAERVGGGGNLDALAPFDLEAANLRQAIERAAVNDADKALRLCAALAAWWHARGLFSDGEAAYRRALEAAAGPRALRARVLAARAYLQLFAGHNEEARSLADEATAEAEATGDGAAAVHALGVLAGVRVQGDPLGARPQLERCWSLAGTHGPTYTWIAVGQTLAASYLWADDTAGARRVLDELQPAVDAGAANERLGHQTFCRAWIEYSGGRLDRARELLVRAIAETAEPNWRALAQAYLWQVDADRGAAADRVDALRALRDEMLERGALMTLPWVQAILVAVSAAAGELEAAVTEARAGAALIRDRAAHALVLLEVAHAEALRLLGRAAESEEVARGVLAEAERIGNPRRLAARAQLVLGRLAGEGGRWAEAEQMHHAALDALLAGGHHADVPAALDGLAVIAAGLHSHGEAARITGAAARARAELVTAAWPAQRRELEALAARLGEALGPPARDAAVAEGAALTPADAVAWLRRARGARKRPPGGWESLTPTELEVVKHVVDGLTNRAIGARMFIAAGTVKVHLSHVYAKLNTPNRAALAREASRRLTAH